jgi:hypothetical protein
MTLLNHPVVPRPVEAPGSDGASPDRPGVDGIAMRVYRCSCACDGQCDLWGAMGFSAAGAI